MGQLKFKKIVNEKKNLKNIADDQLSDGESTQFLTSIKYVLYLRK